MLPGPMIPNLFPKPSASVSWKKTWQDTPAAQVTPGHTHWPVAQDSPGPSHGLLQQTFSALQLPVEHSPPLTQATPLPFLGAHMLVLPLQYLAPLTQSGLSPHWVLHAPVAWSQA